jgi:ankyrin repeat protein
MKELYEAVRAGDAARVQALVAADPALAVFAAAITGDVAQLEEVLGGNRSLVSATSSDGWTPLHLAAHFGRTDAVRLLLNKGAQVNVRSTNALANCAIHAAAAGGSAATVKLLADFGADVNARQHGGWAAIHAAAQSGNVEMAQVLCDSGADLGIRAGNQQRPIDLALTQGHQAMVDFLESRGAVL